MSPKAPKSFALTIPSRLDEMVTVHALVGEAIKEYRLSDELAHWIELTISESMINAIQHGNKSDPTKEASLQISSDGNMIEIMHECGLHTRFGHLDKILVNRGEKVTQAVITVPAYFNDRSRVAGES